MKSFFITDIVGYLNRNFILKYNFIGMLLNILTTSLKYGLNLCFDVPYLCQLCLLYQEYFQLNHFENQFLHQVPMLNL